MNKKSLTLSIWNLLEVLVKPSKTLIQVESRSNKSLRQKMQSIDLRKPIFNISMIIGPYYNVTNKKK